MSLINSMPIVQPGSWSCPALIDAGGHLLTFQFRARARGPVLATATYQAFPGLVASSGQCDPLQLSIRGRPEPSLLGGRFAAQAQRILGFGLLVGR